MSTWSGKTLGRVKIGELIARGGMAEVYAGEHTSLNRKVAIKIMRDHVDTDPETQSRFEREARVVASLRHPNIIQMFDYELVEDGRPCLIMELVPGASLANYLKALHERGEKLPLNMVSQILFALASAIDYAHEQHIVHRDIKPANILLRSASGPVDSNKPLPEDVEPILTDFGLVRLLDSSIQTSTGTVSGTPAYMSPEQARGDKVDRKTDIYSLGVVLYEMLAGRVPFDAESSFGLLMKHINDRPPRIENISSDLQTVMDRALAKDPHFRYSSGKELANEFIAVFNGETVSINTADLAKMAQQASQPKQARPFPWVWVGIGALILVGLAFVTFRFFGSSPLTENQSVGRVSLLDFNALMDRATITVSGLPMPEPGTHYEVWYLAEGGETRHNIGAINMDNAAQGQLVFNNSDQENILSQYDQLEVTIESDGNPNPDKPSDEIIASSVFPPLALIHVRHLVVAFQNAPNEIALIQGLWSTADTIDTNTIELQKAFNDNDEQLVLLKTEQIINQLAGNTNTDLYRDWNENGTIDDPGDGYGLLENGDQGYILNTISHSQYAAESADATENIQLHSENVVLCLENMKIWSEQLLEKTRQLQGMPFGPDMEPLIEEMVFLSNQILFGADLNGNEIIQPITGEGGGATAYEDAYLMAEMPLLIGEHRIPSPASISQP